ncbi:MAG: hypothetical protein EOO36_15000, partial [Cytophagaceae bacterium]
MLDFLVATGQLPRAVSRRAAVALGLSASLLAGRALPAPAQVRHPASPAAAPADTTGHKYQTPPTA